METNHCMDFTRQKKLLTFAHIKWKQVRTIQWNFFTNVPRLTAELSKKFSWISYFCSFAVGFSTLSYSFFAYRSRYGPECCVHYVVRFGWFQCLFRNDAKIRNGRKNEFRSSAKNGMARNNEKRPHAKFRKEKRFTCVSCVRSQMQAVF